MVRNSILVRVVEKIYFESLTTPWFRKPSFRSSWRSSPYQWSHILPCSPAPASQGHQQPRPTTTKESGQYQGSVKPNLQMRQCNVALQHPTRSISSPIQ